MLRKLFAAIAVGSLVALGGGVAANADEPEVVLTASPTTITLGQNSTLTVTGLEDGVPVIFSISSPSLPNDGGMLNPETLNITGGSGITTFTPNAVETYVIDVTNPNNEGPPYASVTIVVNAVAPVVPVLPATGADDVSPWLIVAGVGTMALGAFLVVRASARRRPREH